MPDVIYLTKDFEPVDKDDPRMAMVKVHYENGRVVFGIPEKPSTFQQGGEGSGHHGHEGRPGQVGGSSPSNSGKHFTDVNFGVLHEELSPEGREAVRDYTLGNMSQKHFVSIMKREEYVAIALQDELRNIMDEDGYVAVYRGGPASTERFSNATLDIQKARDYASGFTGFDLGTVTEYRVPLENFFAFGSSGEQEVFFKFDKKVKTTTIRNSSLFIQGGQGSGHEGHAGRPGQVGGSVPSQKGKSMLVHHGTSLKAVEDIKKNGILAKKPPIGKRPPSVFFMQEFQQTKDYVEEVHLDQGLGYAIVSFDIPDGINIIEDEEEGDSYRIEQNVPPEWISSIVYYDANNNRIK